MTKTNTDVKIPPRTMNRSAVHNGRGTEGTKKEKKC